MQGGSPKEKIVNGDFIIARPIKGEEGRLEEVGRFTIQWNRLFGESGGASESVNDEDFLRETKLQKLEPKTKKMMFEI